MPNNADPAKLQDMFFGIEPPPAAADDMITMSPEAQKLSRVAKGMFWGPVTNDRPQPKIQLNGANFRPKV